MLLGKDPLPGAGQSAPGDPDLPAELIRDGRYAEAFRLLGGPGTKNVSQLFNLALCHIYAEDHSGALVKLEAALSAVRQSGVPSLPPEPPVAQKIRGKQNFTDVYMLPVTEMYVKTFPETMQDSILRLTVDCHAALGNWNKVLETGTPIGRKGYGNVDRALREAENNR